MNSAVEIRKDDRFEVDHRPDPFIQMIERVVLDPQASVEKLERMLQLRNEEVENNRRRAREDAEFVAKRAYFAAMSKCQTELPVVTKNRKNDHTKSTYADLAAIEEQAMPIIHKHGFAVSFQPDGYNELGELRILWEISHEEGHVRNGDAGIPVDGAGSQGKVNKTGTQAFGSTATYGRRYLLCMLFNISTGDDRDGNAIGKGAPISEDQLRQLWAIMDEVGASADKFCEVYDIQAVPDLPASMFDDAVQNLRAYGKRQAGGGRG
ncbi:ERF family protein [Mesorhizobium sp. M4A.F.Ca.ET.090.04.2.1]|uniref:ERF family protein n=1 Tax=Mesorhizobium sp. M4A.F.Ca.ET.090.04.2.1 TaxID=2496663 RepID=UPI000FCBD8F7|nr:ERF family protein [Mesorhizobium sp. M4A.F.Ca.ET.090.04.2.1]RVC47623.1 ERF family protein [Mesorhizobium sp. M4A.F.Ca.ET.090.04.2.1]